MSFSDDEVERYARHLMLREIGGQGQQALKGAKVLIVGAGGLGSPAALYLAAAGVGQIGLVDADSVSLSNLQRQILYRTADVGAPKVSVAAARLREINPHVNVAPIQDLVTEENAERLLAPYDLILDGCDNFPTRFVVNDAAVKLGKPLISGAIGRWTGQVGLFNARPCYRCLVPEIPPDAETCSAVGVVGALAGVVGAMMALEAIKWLTSAGQSLAGRILIYDGLGAVARTVSLPPDPLCPACGSGAD